MIHHGAVDCGKIKGDVNQDCLTCSYYEGRTEIETCSDGFGGHSWEEVTHYCTKKEEECPEENIECDSYI